MAIAVRISVTINLSTYYKHTITIMAIVNGIFISTSISINIFFTSIITIFIVSFFHEKNIIKSHCNSSLQLLHINYKHYYCFPIHNNQHLGHIIAQKLISFQKQLFGLRDNDPEVTITYVITS